MLPGVVLWVCVFESGVHATIAGVVLGLLTPARPINGHKVIEPLEARLHPWSSFVIVPAVRARQRRRLPRRRRRRAARSSSAITWGVILGLVVGKPLGIVTTAALADRFRIGRLPDGVQLKHLLAAGAVAGIGFTVSLFVAGLSYRGVRLADAKVAILGASVVSGIVGFTALRLTTRTTSASSDPERSP